MAGVLSGIVSLVRTYADEPSQVGGRVKFTNTAIMELAEAAWPEVVGEVNALGDDKIRVRHDISILANTREYALPPYIGQILSVEHYSNSTPVANTHMLWEIEPRNFLNPSGPGWLIEGPMLYVDPVFTSNTTVRLTYVPNGEMTAHQGTGTFTATNNGSAVTAVTSVTLASSPSLGLLDGRKAAYSGCVLRILTSAGGWKSADSSVVQERVITSYNNETRVATFAPSLSPLPAYTGTALDNSNCTYEVVPLHMALCKDVLALKVARKVSNVIGDTTRARSLHFEYQDALRTLRLNSSRKQARTGDSFKRNTRGRKRGGRIRLASSAIGTL